MKTLGSSLKGVRGEVGNNTKYAPWVGSQRFQARMHRGRWTTDEGALTSERANIEDDFNAAVAAALSVPTVTRNPLFVAMQAATMRVQRVMAHYPAPPVNSRYRRTLTYGRRWTTRVTETS